MGVSGLVNHTHPTFAKFLKNPVMQDALADHWSGTVYGIRMLERVWRRSQRKENPISSGQPIMGPSTRQKALIVPRTSTGCLHILSEAQESKSGGTAQCERDFSFCSVHSPPPISLRRSIRNRFVNSGNQLQPMWKPPSSSHQQLP